jgi:hypothetical protein
MRDIELQEMESGRDTQDARLMLTIDSAGRQFGPLSPVPIHSCINIAMQTDHGDNEDGHGGLWSSFTGCITKAMMQRLAMIIGGILVVVTIILLERFLGTELFDEKKLIHDITAELLPQLVNARNATPTPPPAAVV